MTTKVSYEADAYPEASSPAWTRATNGIISRTLASSTLQVATGIGSTYDRYTRSENPFRRGDLTFSVKGPGGTTLGAFDVSFLEAASGQDVRTRVNELGIVSFYVGDQSAIVGDYLASLSDFLTFRIQMVTVGSGLPKAHLFINGTLVSTLTSGVAFEPDNVRFETLSGAPLGSMRVTIDYVRYALMGSGGSRQRRTGDMIPDVKKPAMAKEKEKEPKTMYITFPQDGSTESVAAGDLLLNFWDGTARLPDGTEKKLSGKLEGSGHDYMNAIYFDNPDQDITISLDNMGSFLIEANSFRGIILQPFRQAKIRTTATTSIKVFASTDGKSGLVAA